jgi:hypothetical protein
MSLDDLVGAVTLTLAHPETLFDALEHEHDESTSSHREPFPID